MKYPNASLSTPSQAVSCTIEQIVTRRRRTVWSLGIVHRQAILYVIPSFGPPNLRNYHLFYLSKSDIQANLAVLAKNEIGKNGIVLLVEMSIFLGWVYYIFNSSAGELPHFSSLPPKKLLGQLSTTPPPSFSLVSSSLPCLIHARRPCCFILNLSDLSNAS